MSKTLSDLQIAKRDEIVSESTAIIADAEAEGRSLTDDEAAIVRAAAEAVAAVTEVKQRVKKTIAEKIEALEKRVENDTAKLEEIRTARNKATDALNDHVKAHNQLVKNASVSDYGRAAIALDNGKHGKKDAYWTNPQEMFARA